MVHQDLPFALAKNHLLTPLGSTYSTPVNTLEPTT